MNLKFYLEGSAKDYEDLDVTSRTTEPIIQETFESIRWDLEKIKIDLEKISSIILLKQEEECCETSAITIQAAVQGFLSAEWSNTSSIIIQASFCRFAV